MPITQSAGARSSSEHEVNFSSMVSLLRRRVQEYGVRAAYIYLQDGETEETRLSFVDLDLKARVIAAELQERGAVGQRALLLYPPGPEYIAALFGCFYAGVCAVPAYPPRPNQSLLRLEAVVKDAQASFALTTATLYRRKMREQCENTSMAHLTWLTTDESIDRPTPLWKDPNVDRDTLALLQYTSGSTGSPKGVMVSHGNLLHNAHLLTSVLGHSIRSHGVSWLPPYHDMGLVGGIIVPVYAPFTMVHLSPVHFLQKPLRWLSAISRYKASIGVGPNFAYDLCVRKIKSEDRAGLDLSSWEIAFNGAERIRPDTLNRFAKVFGPVGFKLKTFFPCYGLAESTLIVSGGPRDRVPHVVSADPEALETGTFKPTAATQSNGTSLVGCGHAMPEQQVVIVDPETRIPCNYNGIGEIWVSSPSVAQGYWNRPEETAATFKATLEDYPERFFMRTEDLGFLHEGELFVTGRMKDLIIIRGRNHYPEDIERTVEKSHRVLRPGCGAAFALESEGEERLTVVQEVERSVIRSLKGYEADKVMDAIRSAVSRDHELQVHSVILVYPYEVPKTSSGKVQRRLCRRRLQEGKLKVVAQSSSFAETASMVSESESRIQHMPVVISDALSRADGVDAYLRQSIANLLKCPVIALNPDKPLTALGMDSIMAMELKIAMEEKFHVEIPVETIFAGGSMGDFTTLIVQLMAGEELPDARVSISCDRGLESTEVSSVLFSNEENNAWQKTCDFEDYPEYHSLNKILTGLESRNISNPYFRMYEGVNRDTARLRDRNLINFSSYNYLGLSGHPAVSEAAKQAIDRYGTSVSASRVASGERPVHSELEQALAGLVGTEDCLVFVGGHATNVTTIGHLFKENDLILYDELIHNSILQGCTLSGAGHRPFPHNDPDTLDAMLRQSRGKFRRVLIALEGVYSMDGDIPDLPKFIEIKKRHQTLLMIDEAHSMGVLGKKGHGIREHFDIVPSDVDIWMGTLSKSFASCGGYICGSKPLVTYLKYTAPGFVYSVGMPASNAAAALAAVQILLQEPERVKHLHELANLFRKLAIERGMNIGKSRGTPIVPIIVGDSLKAMKLSQALLQEGIDALPMIFPAVPDHAARLRFFVNWSHSPEQIRYTVEVLARQLQALLHVANSG